MFSCQDKNIDKSNLNEAENAPEFNRRVFIQDIIPLNLRIGTIAGCDRDLSAILPAKVKNNYEREPNMDRSVAEKTARHEAGHLVMKWYLKLPATKTEIFNADEGLCYGSGEEIRQDDGKFLTAAGFAAEFYRTPEILEQFMLNYQCEYSEEEEFNSDFDALWHLFDRWGFYSDRMIYNFCITAFYEARNILYHYWEKVDEVTELLLDNDIVSQTEAQRLFQKWGDPEFIPSIYAKISHRLLDVTDDCARRANNPA
jgi:hypothetical protein